MKIKHLIILILAISLVFTTGCNEQNTDIGMANPFIGGTTGITMEFLEDAPPLDKVHDGGEYPFTAVVKIKNMGESDIEIGDATIKISGIDATDFGTTPALLTQNNDEIIYGTKKNAEGSITEGTIFHLTFPKDSEFNYEGVLVGNHQFPFLATSCYKYENKATAMLCVKEDPLDTGDDSVCEINEIKTTYNSGGPIQILNLKETPRGKTSLAFTFEIHHKGTGEFYELNSLCDSSISTSDRVYVAITTGISGLSCTGLSGEDQNSGFVKLHDGKRTITCTQDVSSASGDYEKIVEIVTQYDYEQKITTNVLVKHAAN